MDENENKALTETNDSDVTVDEKSKKPKKKVHAVHAISGVLRLILNLVALFLFFLGYSIIEIIKSNNEIISTLLLSVFGFIFSIAGGIVFLIALILTIIALVRLTAIAARKEKLSIATKIMDVLIVLLTIGNGVFIYFIIAAVA